MSLTWKNDSMFSFWHTKGKIEEIYAENHADKSGLKKGDRIFSINNKNVSVDDDIYHLLDVEAEENDSSVNLSILRKTHLDKSKCKY